MRNTLKIFISLLVLIAISTGVAAQKQAVFYNNGKVFKSVDLTDIDSMRFEDKILEPNIVMDEAFGSFTGKFAEGVDLTVLNLVSKEFVNSKTEGDILQIWLLANSSDEVKLIPGTYTIEKFSEIAHAEVAIGGLGAGLGSNLLTIKGKKIVDFSLISAGKIVITEADGEYSITANVGIDHEERTYVYSGAVEMIDERPSLDDAYIFEKDTLTTESHTYTTLKAEKGKESGLDVVLLDLSSDGVAASILLYTEEGATTINGTYLINDTRAANTALKSIGGDSQGYIYPAFVATLDGGSLVMPIWFLVSGTITVSDTGVTIVAKSYFGSTINGTYAGEVTVVPASGAPMKAAINKVSPLQFAKRKALNVFR